MWSGASPLATSSKIPLKTLAAHGPVHVPPVSSIIDRYFIAMEKVPIHLLPLLSYPKSNKLRFVIDHAISNACGVSH